MVQASKVLFFTTVVFFGFVTGLEASSFDPVTADCVMDHARSQRVPIRLVYGVMRAEGGHVGDTSPNSNGTVDHGPMQINSIWLDNLPDSTVTSLDLLDGCTNVKWGVWILRQKLDENQLTYPYTNKELLNAAGRYHSYTPRYFKRYRSTVRETLNNLESPGSILVSTNELVR